MITEMKTLRTIFQFIYFVIECSKIKQGLLHVHVDVHLHMIDFYQTPPIFQ